MNKMILVIHFVMALACSGGSDFSGGTTKQELVPAESIDGTSQNEAISSKNSGETSSKDSTLSDKKKEPSKTTPDSPSKRIVKGSFTAWTEPQSPAPRQSYIIVIEVKLPSNVKNYKNEDLSGSIDGTDGFRRTVDGLDKLDISPNFKKRFESYGTTAKLFIPVPGAEYLVRDRIYINSALLKESQTIEIVFGSHQ
jgi:hypothetical protein